VEDIMAILLKLLRVLNYIIGVAVILVGLGAYIFSSATISLLLALGIVAVGPLEDLLMSHPRLPGVDPEHTKDLINQGTSLILVLFLLLAIFLSMRTFVV
jgi:hypothetical protein